MRHLRPIFLAPFLAVMPPAAAHADQLCKSTDVRFVNKVPRTIKVLRFEYWDEEDKKWRNENVKDTVLKEGQQSDWMNETLEYVGNEVVENFRVFYKWCGVQNANGTCSVFQVGDRRSKKVSRAGGAKTCVKDMNIKLDVEFVEP